MATIRLKYRQSSVNGNDGTLFFRIIHHRQVRQIYTGLHVSDAEWDAESARVIISPDVNLERTEYLISITESLKECQKKLKAVIKDLEQKNTPYTVQDIVLSYSASKAVDGPVSFTRHLIVDLKIIGKKATVKRFETTLNSFLRYTEGNEVSWKNLSPTFVLGFETFLMKRGLCRNSTSFYMRNLRSIVNRAAEQGFEIPHNLFKHVYTGVDKTVKRAVSLDVIRKIRDIDLTGRPSLDFARKVFMFSFYTRGMSFVDIAFLKKGNLQNGLIIYCRRKTRQQLTVKIEPEISRIIESFGKNDSAFLLPIITDETSDVEQQYERAYAWINRNIRNVGILLGLETRLTLYVARHTWASIAHSNQVALSTISKAMGHDSEKTTVIYLQSLDTSSVDKANSDIIRLVDRKKGRNKEKNSLL